MGLKKKLGIILLVSLFSFFPARANATTLDDISRQMMCPCGCDLVLATCHCDLPNGAAEINALIEEKLAQGQSGEQIIQFFVARYGQQVLVSPKQNSNPMLWSAALIGILTIGIVIYLKQKKQQKKRTRRK